MPFPTSVDSLVDGTTVIHASQVQGVQRITVGPTMVNVKSDQYGALGDGSTDDTAALTAAINAVPAGGGMVYFPPGVYRTSASLPIKSGVTYLGAAKGATSAVHPAQISALAGMATPIFDVTAASTVTSVVFQSLSLNGNNLTGAKGIHSGTAVTAGSWTFRDLFIDFFGDHGIHIEAGGTSTATAFLENVFAQNCLLIRTGRASLVGVIDIAFTDVYAIGCFSSASNAVGDGTGNICGWVPRGSNSTYVACYGDISQIGWGIPSTTKLIRLLGCRALLNNGQGFEVDGGENTVIGCNAMSNSQATDNTSSGFVVTGNSNTFMGCVIDGNAGDAKQQKNGFDDSNSTAGNNGNNYYGNRIGGAVRGILYNGTGTANNVRFEPDGTGNALISGLAGFQLTIDALTGSSNSQINLIARAAGVAKQAVIRAGQTGNLQLNPLAGTAISCGGPLQPSTDAGAAQTGQVFQGSGVPNNANGNNGDVYFRTDTPGTANQRMYMKSAGAWVALTL